MIVELFTIMTLLVQAIALGHGAVQLAYHRDRPWWWWIPIVLILVYNASLFLLKPHILVNPGSYPSGGLYYSLRYASLALCFTLVVEGLYVVLKRVTFINNINQGKITALTEQNNFLIQVLKDNGSEYGEPAPEQKSM